MMMHSISSLVFIILSLLTSARAADCLIDITQLGVFHPLLLDEVTNEILYPIIGSSIIRLGSNAKFVLACPGTDIQIAGISIGDTEIAMCDSGWDVEILGDIHDLKDIECARRITSVARYTGQPCWQLYKEIEIGFLIQGDRFLHEMTVCFDDVARNVIYSQFLLTKLIGSQTKGNPSPGWTEDNFYNLADSLNILYETIKQRPTINRQLGLPDTDKKYIKTGQYVLVKGHLAARTDFIYNAQQQATFHYVNSVPQWQIFNAGNWLALERSLRSYASNKMVDLTVYTGTYGTSTLPHESTGQDIPLYFYINAGNPTKAMPVPELFWKIVYDPLHQAGVAVLGFNNAYKIINANSIICTDIGDQLTWLTFNRKNNKYGYVYACTIDDLRRVIPQIPMFNVTSILN